MNETFRRFDKMIIWSALSLGLQDGSKIMITNKQIILGLGLCRLTCMWRLPRPPVTMSRLVVGLVLELLLPCPESALSTTGGLIMALARSSEGLNMALAWSSDGLIMASA